MRNHVLTQLFVFSTLFSITQIPDINEWQITNEGEIQGKVYNHPTLLDGDGILSSVLANPQIAMEGAIVETMTGSLYRLGPASSEELAKRKQKEDEMTAEQRSRDETEKRALEEIEKSRQAELQQQQKAQKQEALKRSELEKQLQEQQRQFEEVQKEKEKLANANQRLAKDLEGKEAKLGAAKD